MSKAILLALMVLAAIPVTASATVLEGKVTSIIDGDEFTVMTEDGEDVHVRLAEITAPNIDQPYGHEAADALAVLVEDRLVRVAPVKIVEGVVRARVYVDSLNVNYSMVRNGHARADHGIVSDYMLYSLESEARKARRGVWETDSPN